MLLSYSANIRDGQTLRNRQAKISVYKSLLLRLLILRSHQSPSAGYNTHIVDIGSTHESDFGGGRTDWRKHVATLIVKSKVYSEVSESTCVL